MASKKRIDPESEAALEVINAEQLQDEIKVKTQLAKEHSIAQIYKLAGKIEAMQFTKSQADFFSLVMLKQVKDAKEYREKFGLTWEAFCKEVGVSRRWIDEQLDDLKPFKSQFLEAFLQFSGVEFHKIKYLGDAVSGGTAEIKDGNIIYQGEIVPFTSDDVQALLERLEETYKAQIDDQKASIRTKERQLNSLNDLLKKQEKALSRLENKVELEPLSEEDAEAFSILKKVQSDFIDGISTIKSKVPASGSSEKALRQLYFLYIFMSKVCMEERMALHEIYKDAEDVPWEIVEQELPPTEVLVNEMPLTAGMGKAYKDKIKARKK